MIVAMSVPCGAGMRAEPMPCSSPGTRVIEQEDRAADDERRDEHADDAGPICWLDRRGADEIAGLEILRRRAGVGRAMHTMAPTMSAIDWCMSLVQCSETKMRQVAMSVAMVMPEIGFDDAPMMPTMRDDTVTKKKPKTTTSSAHERASPGRCRAGSAEAR